MSIIGVMKAVVVTESQWALCKVQNGSVWHEWASDIESSRLQSPQTPFAKEPRMM